MATHQYEPLPAGENTLEDSDCQPRHSSSWTRVWKALQMFLLLETVHAMIFAAVYFLFFHRQHSSFLITSLNDERGCSRLPASLRSHTRPVGIPLLGADHASSPLLQTYLSLHEYTMPYILSDNNLTFLRNTLSDDYYFNLTFQHRHGLVSLPDGSDLTTLLDLPVTSLPDASAPPDHSVYKVSAFHHLHCLRRIQRWITTHPPFAAYNNTEFDQVYPLVESQSQESLDELNHLPAPSHVLHCVDWIRQVLMCDADLRIVLSNTDPNFLELGGEPVRMCRDWGAIASWVDEHQH